MEKFVKSDVAGQYLGLAPLTIRRMAHRGELPAYGLPVGGGKFTYRFKLSELLAWANNLKKCSPRTEYEQAETLHNIEKGT